MATTTPRIGLTKPDGTDLVDVAVLNTNFDKIDSNIASTKIQATKPTTANAGDLWWDSNTGTLYLYYTDANSSQWVAATSDPVNIGVVANQGERDAQYPTPGQGMSVYRTDLGYRENYYGLYNVSTNPGGRTPAGWYSEGPLGVVGFSNTLVNGSFNANTLTEINSVSVPIRAGRRYKASAKIAVQPGSTVSSNVFTVWETSIGHKTVDFQTSAIGANLNKSFSGFYVFTAAELGVTSGASDKTIKSFFRCGSAGGVNPNPDAIIGANSFVPQLVVEDIGAA